MQVQRDLMLAAASGAVFVALTAGLADGGVLVDVDLAVYRWSEAHRPEVADLVARVLNRLGQGLWLLTICAVLAGWLAVVRWRAREPWRRLAWPLVYVGVAAALVIPTVLAIKHVTGRGAPSSDLPMQQTVALFGSLPPGEYATGYPGGHAVNTVVWYGVLLVLVTALLRAYGRGDPPWAVRAAVRLVPPVVVLFTTTYLSYHWLTDGLAGLALGFTIDRLLAPLASHDRDPATGTPRRALYG